MILAYCRVSTIEQAQDGRTSMSAQEATIRLIALSRGAAEPVFFRDPGVSGSVPLSERPGGRDMLGQAVAGDIIVAAKLDRMFRSASDALVTVEALRARVIHVVLADISHEPVTENGVGKLFFSIMASVAEFERGRIAERANEGRKGKKQRGGHIGGDAPYGWTKVGSGRTAMLVRNETEQDTLARIERIYRETRSPNATALQLNAMRVPAREGIWHRGQIDRIVKRTTAGAGHAPQNSTIFQSPRLRRQPRLLSG